MSDIHDLEVNLDLKQNLNIYTTCKQLDNLNLIFNVYDNSVQADLSNYNVRLKAMKADNVPLIQDTQYKIVSNVVTIAADEQLTTTSGITKIELQFINKTTGEKKATFNLNLKVIASTLEVERSISTATYTLLEELENKIDQASDLAENIDKAIEMNNTLSTTITDATNTKNTLEIDIATGNALNVSLENNITSGNKSNASLETSINAGNTLKASLDAANTKAEANITVMESLGDVSELAKNVQKNTDSISLVNTQLSENTQDVSELSKRNYIINGNLDVWQRGTSYINPTNGTYLADRFNLYNGISGTLPTTITHSKSTLTNGEVPNASSAFRIAVDGSGILNSTDIYLLHQMIENGNKKLCGADKKITVSFWAKSNITNKRLGISLTQNYGTGGSPSTVEVIIGNNFSLSQTWKKFSVTVSTNTLLNKVFGSNNDDYLALNFSYAWGVDSAFKYSATTGETFGGNGYIDIAQIKLESGDKVTPFVPRLYGEELALCQRYYESSSFLDCFAPVANFVSGAQFKVGKRVIPTVVITSFNGTSNALNAWGANTTPITITSTVKTVDRIQEINVIGASVGTSYVYKFSADAEIY